MTPARGHIEHSDKKKLRLINFISFLFGFSQALLLYVMSDYFREAIKSDKSVGVFYFIAYCVVLAGMLNMHKIIRHLGKITAYSLFFFLQICFVIFLVFLNPSLPGALLLMAFIIVNSLVYVLLDIILEEYSEDRKSGRIRGLYLTMGNVGFLVGPLLSVHLLNRFGFNGLFLFSASINMAIFIIGLVGLHGSNGKFVQKLTTRDVAKKILVNKDVMRIYTISFVLEFFYALMVVYTPLYLLNEGVSWSNIGIIFTFMLLPFALFEYPIGVIADKRLGEKEMLILGILIIGFSTAGIYFMQSNAIWLWCLMLFLTRFGATFVDILRDSYFYKKIDGRDMDMISFFRTTRPVSYIVSMAMSTMLLSVFPVRQVFLLISLVVLAGLYPAFKLVDNKCEAELECVPEEIGI
jgi:MFS family permease